MKALVVTKKNLPDNVKDLHRFILIAPEKLKSVRAEINAIDKAGLAKEVRDQKTSEGQQIGEAILWAEAKMGEILKAIPKKGNKYGSTGGTIPTLPEGISKKQSHRAQVLADNPDLIEDVIKEAKENEDIPTKTEVLKKAKQRKQEKKHEDIVNIDVIKGKYRCIVVDPPWDIKKIERQNIHQGKSLDYPTMSIDEIKDIKLPTSENCHLWLWTTQKYLPVAFDVLDHWGFKYVFTMTWRKNGGFQPFGLPQYNSEFCIFGRMGKLDFLSTKNFFTCFNAKRREHSRKPDEFYDLVNRVSPSPRIDYYSREEREGFDQFGKQSGKF